MADAAAAVLALWNDVDPALEDAYNDWHAQEHVPERCTVPGILWGRRYRHAGGAMMPRYLTLYGLRHAAVLDSAPYQRLLREPTPMSRRMRPALLRVSRWVCRVHADTSTGAGERLAVLALGDDAAARAAVAGMADSARRLLAERIPEAAAPLPWLGDGQAAGIEGAWLLCVEVDALEPAPPLALVETARYAALAVG